MAEIILTDLDDDGFISVFAKGSQLLFTCSEGHWWTVEATGSGTSKTARAKPKKPLPITDVDLTADKAAPLRDLVDQFGDAPLRAMRMKAL